jgi:hypothetical protein
MNVRRCSSPAIVWKNIVTLVLAVQTLGFTENPPTGAPAEKLGETRQVCLYYIALMDLPQIVPPISGAFAFRM